LPHIKSIDRKYIRSIEIDFDLANFLHSSSSELGEYLCSSTSFRPFCSFLFIICFCLIVFCCLFNFILVHYNLVQILCSLCLLLPSICFILFEQKIKKKKKSFLFCFCSRFCFCINIRSIDFYFDRSIDFKLDRSTSTQKAVPG
jgi:uncharacterized membrane protein